MKRLLLVVLTVWFAALSVQLFAQEKIVWSDQEKPIYNKVRKLRSMSDKSRAKATAQLALEIRALPKTENKVRLATGLASLSTEGDFGHQTLQEVATTLTDSLREQPQPPEKGQPAYPYVALAQLERYEHVTVSLEDPQFSAAKEMLVKEDEHRQDADFTLSDLNGQQWNLHSLKGKVVLLNFWATWCPPCNRELPDLEDLYNKYKKQGLVILAVSDEDAAKVKPFIHDRGLTFPVLLDPGRHVNEDFGIEGIPKSFVYDRDGKLVAEAIDMRTRNQFEQMLSSAGLK